MYGTDESIAIDGGDGEHYQNDHCGMMDADDCEHDQNDDGMRDADDGDHDESLAMR